MEPENVQPHVVVMPPSATIRNAEAIRSALLDAFAGHRSVSIDCTRITDIDVSFIQTVLAARRAAARDGVVFRLTAPADGALLRALRQGGILGDDAPAPAFWSNG